MALGQLLRHDRALDHLDLVAVRQRGHRAAGDAVQEAVGRRGVDLAVEHEADVGAGALGHLAAPVVHQGVVEALGLGLMLGQRADHVQAGGLGRGRRRVRAGTLPLGDAQADALHAVGAEQVGPGPAGDRQVDLGLLRGHGELFAAAPGDRADIGVHQAVGRDDLLAGGVDLLGGPGDLEAQDAAGCDQPLGMGAQHEDVAGISPLAFEHAAGIVQPVGQNVQLGVAPGDHLAIQPDLAVTVVERNKRHLPPPT